MVPLSEIAEAISRPVSVTAGESYRTIGVKWWGEGAYERETIDGSRTAAKTLSLVREGDLIINKIWVRHGSTAIASKAVDGCAASGEFPTFKLNQNRVVPRWIHWQTKARDFWTKCDALSRGTSGKNRIKPELFLTIGIPLPPLPEQRRIVARIEELAAQIHETRGLRQRAAEEVEVLTKSELAAIVNCLVNRIGVHLLGDLILSANYGTSTKCTCDRGVESIPVLRIPNVALERVNFDDLKFGALSKRELEGVLLSQGDVLIVRTNGSADLVGRSAVVPPLAEPTAFASYMIRLHCDRDVITPEYLQLMLKHLRTDSQLIDFARTTAGQYNVSLGRLRVAELPVPSLAEQRRIVAYMDRLQVKADALKQLQAETADELDALLPSVLNKAFHGEL